MAYATAAEIKTALKITDSGRDSLVADALAAAETAVDDHCGRTFGILGTAAARTFNARRRTLDTYDGQRLLLCDDIGSLTGLVVEIGSGTSWTTITTYVEAEPLNAITRGKPVTSLLYIGGTWPSGGGERAKVTALWGWPSVPEPVQQATRIMAMRLFKRKDSVEGMVGSADWGIARISRSDPDVVSLLAPYVVPWAAA